MAKLPPFGWSTTLRSPAEMFGFCQKVAEFLRAMGRLEILRGQLLEGEGTSTSEMVIHHELGRPYKGALLLAQSDLSRDVRVEYPDQADDPAKAVEVAFSGPYTGRVKLWVF